MPFTLALAKTYLRDWNRQATSALDERIVTKCANDGNRAFHQFGEWDFDKRRLQFALAAPYSTGTVTVTANSTTITGSGTAWTTAMNGFYFRVGGAPEQYQFTYVSPTSGTISPAYLGSSASAQNYQLTNERYTLPVDFRTMCEVQINEIVTPMESTTNENIVYARKFYREVSYPRSYAIEWVPPSSYTTPAPYLWVYPAPSEQYVVDMFYYIQPTELTSDSDVFQVPAPAEGVLREFMVAALLNYQRDPGWSAQLGKARREAEISLAAFRARKEMNYKQDWNPMQNMGQRRDPLIDLLAPGEPRYI